MLLNCHTTSLEIGCVIPENLLVSDRGQVRIRSGIKRLAKLKLFIKNYTFY